MKIDDIEKQKRLEFIDLADRDVKLLKQLAAIIGPHIPGIVDAVFTSINQQSEMNEILDFSEDGVEEFKSAQRVYLNEVFSGQYDSTYFASRLEIGSECYRIGFTPRWYLGSHAIYMKQIVPIILRHWWWRPDKATKSIQALGKVFALDTQLSMDAYIDCLSEDPSRAYFSGESLQHSIAQYMVLVREVARGNLTHKVEVEGDTDLTHLGDSLNHMVESLAAMTSNVTQFSEFMLDTAREVNSVVVAQSVGATQQASAVNQTTTTLEQISATAQQNLGKATSLFEVTKLAKSEGNDGLVAVEKAIVAMQDVHGNMEDISTHIAKLDDSLKQIEEITDTVDDLAQQSRMLALNASIESAKAGEAGKGFSVVAEEVKELAEQSRNAAAQVKSILSEVKNASTKAVHSVATGNSRADKGAELTEQAGVVLQGLNKVINEAALSSQQMVATIRQETAGIEQIRTAMREINSITGQFVTATAKADSATAKFTSNAAKLQDMVGNFVVETPYFDFELARAVHRDWVTSIEAFLDGEDNISVETAISHHECELGKWYDTQGMALYGHIDQMEQLGHDHKLLHEFINRVVSKQEQGVKVNKKDVMGYVSNLSAQILSHLAVIQSVAVKQSISTQKD
ncbi:MAG: hypothetical protein GY753_02050 [Gammaproteobacteria bacterium]|nr:hypothetical protein [Gammaproteobacteria bacterium]